MNGITKEKIIKAKKILDETDVEIKGRYIGIMNEEQSKKWGLPIGIYGAENNDA
jgi:hypothetical protein